MCLKYFQETKHAFVICKTMRGVFFLSPMAPRGPRGLHRKLVTLYKIGKASQYGTSFIEKKGEKPMNTDKAVLMEDAD